MSKKWLWDLVRRKNPLVKRNAWVFAHGEHWRIANTDGDAVILRKEIRVHAADIETAKVKP